LLISLVIVDCVLNLFYLATAVYFTYNTTYISAFVLLDISFFFLIVFTAAYANYCIFKKYQRGFTRFGIIRILVEMIKIVKALLILNSVNGNY